MRLTNYKYLTKYWTIGKFTHENPKKTIYPTKNQPAAGQMVTTTVQSSFLCKNGFLTISTVAKRRFLGLFSPKSTDDMHVDA